MSKIEGIKDDIDVFALAKSFEAFKDAIQLLCDKANKLEVELAFESSLDNKTHYSYSPDEIVTVSGCKINPINRKIIFTTIFGASDKIFYLEDGELINVVTPNDDTGTPSSKSFKQCVDEAFTASFTSSESTKIHSVAALQAMIRNNIGLVDVLNDPGKYLEQIENAGARIKAYTSLNGFGRY